MISSQRIPRSAIRILLILGCAVGISAAEESTASHWPILELRQYTLLPGQRDVLIKLFEAEFVETQEEVGMKIIGTFRDLDKPDRFVWLRAFTDMASRPEGLKALYYGPVWKAHRQVANATMVDSENVLLLHVARPDAGFPPAAHPRAPKGTTNIPTGLVIATIYYFNQSVGDDFLRFFETRVRPRVESAGFPVIASFVTEKSANNFPQLPIRENEQVFVWFSKAADAAAHQHQWERLSNSPEWKNVASELQSRLKSAPEVLRLQPTARSELRD